MEKLKELFKNHNKKLLVNLSIAFVAGIMLIASGGLLSANSGKNTNTGAAADLALENAGLMDSLKDLNPTKSVYAASSLSYEQELEKRLEDVLSMVSGAGEVKVMLTLSNGREIVVAQNTEYDKKSTKETDNEGGIREIDELKTRDDVLIISKRSGDSEPLVLKELQPKVEGVIIIAKGADDIIVKDALTRAANAVLGVEIHKIQVLKMK